jgi:signal transduction histidine kinase
MDLKFSLFWRGRSGRLILILFASIILLHLIILGVFTSSRNTANFRLNHNLMVRQVTELLYTIQQTPPAEQDKTIKAVAIPSIKLSMDDEPDSKLMLNLSAPAWLILHDISQEKTTDNITLSVFLPSGEWLNVNAAVERNAWTAEISLFLLEVILAIIIFTTLWSINRFTGPLRRFRKAAESLGVDMDPQPLAEYGPSIVRDTAHAINQMQHRIRDLLRHRMQMLAALSHDLRTPITRLKLRAQFIDDEALQEKINNDLDQIEAMVNETLLYVREEMRMDEKHKFDLNALLNSICSDYVDTGAAVTFAGAGKHLPLQGSVSSLKRAFTNLIDNALKYAGSVNIKVVAHKKRYEIQIEDHGEGIKDSEKKKVFDPFYRTEGSRSRDTGGTGLGLAIVREVIHAHNGKISLHDAVPHGLLVKIIL